jgi:hypothetical protein
MLHTWHETGDLDAPTTNGAANWRDGRTDASRALLGEHRLLIAILQDAIHCYQKHLHATTWRGRRLFREVERWFTESDTGATISFQTVCDGLGIDPGYVRRGLHRWRVLEGPNGAKPLRHPTLRRSGPDRGHRVSTKRHAERAR